MSFFKFIFRKKKRSQPIQHQDTVNDSASFNKNSDQMNSIEPQSSAVPYGSKLSETRPPPHPSSLKADYITFDFETANETVGSICQIGVAVVKNGKVTDTYSQLVDPEEPFDGVNISVHGITAEDVEGHPTYPEAIKSYTNLFNQNLAISHSSFDKRALEAASKKYNIPNPLVYWGDSMKIVRRVWPDKYGKAGYGLANVARDFGIKFKHHDAEGDAKATALIILRAIQETGKTVEDLANLSSKPKSPRRYKPIVVETNQAVSLKGQIVFTGAMDMTRSEAAELAAHHGFEYSGTVTKKTTILVVGSQDPRRLKGSNKSSKQRKAEKYIEEGQQISIYGEDEFINLLESVKLDQ